MSSPINAPAGTRKSMTIRVILGVVLFVVGVLFLEGLTSVGLLAGDIRKLQPPPVENFRQAQYDSLLGWIGLPNLSNRDNFGPGLTLTTNADGLRIHRATTQALASGERRLICSGASFTFGSGVGDSATFCARLEVEFPGLRTLNMAQRGYGIDQSYLAYQRDGARYQHQWQLLVLNGSDIDRTAATTLTGYPKPVLKLVSGRLVPKNVPVPRWEGWSRWQDAKSLLPRLRIVQLLARRFDMSELAQYRRVDAQLWPLVDTLFANLIRLNRDRGSLPAIVYLPGMPEYAPSARDERREKLATSARNVGITFIDLTADLRAVSPDSLDWMFITPNALPVRGAGNHYTPDGHRWVAARLAAHLRALPAFAATLASVH